MRAFLDCRGYPRKQCFIFVMQEYPIVLYSPGYFGIKIFTLYDIFSPLQSYILALYISKAVSGTVKRNML